MVKLILIICITFLGNSYLQIQNKKGKSGFEMVFVKSGSFTMGGNDNVRDGGPPGSLDECAHTVMLKDFSIGKYEVTQADWVEIMGQNPSHFKDCRDCPVEQVSWEDAKSFIQKVNIKYEEEYRLPTEAEWEYAARGGVKSKGFRYSGSNSGHLPMLSKPDALAGILNDFCNDI